MYYFCLILVQCPSLSYFEEYCNTDIDTPSDIDIGFAAKATVDKALTEKKVSQLQLLEFRNECEFMLQTTVSKVQERSPLKYNLARKLVSMDPRLMVSNPDNATKNVSTSTIDTN